MTYETSNQHPSDGDFGATDLDRLMRWEFTFTAECDKCDWVGPHRASREQAADDMDEHNEKYKGHAGKSSQ